MYILSNFKRKRSAGTILVKNIQYYLKWGLRIVLSGKKIKTILLYPQHPGGKSVIKKILSQLKFNITNNPKKNHHPVVYWHDTTRRVPDSIINDLSEKEFVVNINCTDISKSNVEKVFNEVFGYSNFVEPESFTGLLVKKSENHVLNFIHN